MTSTSVELITSEVGPKAIAQTIARKKGRWRRRTFAGAMMIIASAALWTVFRVEGVPERDAEVDARFQLGTSQERLAKTGNPSTADRPDSQSWRGDADELLSLGVASPENANLDLSLAECSEAARLRPGDADAHARYGALLIVKGKLDEAIAALREAARLKPGRSDVHCKLGRALSAQGKLDEAVAELRDTIRLEPGNVDAHQFLGEALARQGKIDDATEQYVEVDRLKYDPSFALTGLKAQGPAAGNLAISTPPQREARGVMPMPDRPQSTTPDEINATDIRAIEMPKGPQSAAGFFNRSIELVQAMEYDKAISDLNTAIRLDSTFAAAHVVRAEIWLKKDELDKAIGDLNEAIRLDPHGRAYHVRGFAWARKKEFNQAIDDYNDAIRLDPNAASAYTGRGYAWSQKNDYEKGIADYDQAIRLAPDDAGALNGRAWLASTCPDAKYRDGKQAVETATSACELTKWNQPMILDTLAAAYAESGDYDSARKWQTKAIELLTDEKEMDDFRARLKLYQQRRPYRN